MTTIYDTSKFNRRIKIYEYVGGSDGAGGRLDDWKTKEGYSLIFSRWANVIPMSGKYLYETKMAQEKITHDIVVRFHKKIMDVSSKKLVIEYLGARYDVDYRIDVDNQHKFIKMRCIAKHGGR